MSWSHRNIPKVILDRFGMTHFFIIFIKFLTFFECRMSGARILVPLPFWVVPPWFGYVKGYSNRFEGALSVFGFENLIFHLPATMSRGTVALNSKYPTIFDVREYVFWIPLGFPNRLPQGKHMRQHGENDKNDAQNSSK